MGSSCSSSQKNITIPKKVIKIRQKNNQLRGDILNNMIKSNVNIEISNENGIKIDENLYLESNIPEKLSNNNNNDNIKTISTLKGLNIFKYDIKVLGIGEFYMEEYIMKVYNNNNSKTIKETQKDKIKKFKKILENMQNILGTNVLDLVHDLYNQTDILLLEYFKRKPKQYIKLFKFSGGPPMKYRWSLWKNRLDLDQYYIIELYDKIRYLKTSYENDIKKDIHRTFPNESYFTSEQYNYIGQEQLFRVLKAISIYFPNIGYCQGMNFIVAFLLMISGGNEHEAFWFFVALARNPDYMIMGFYEKNFILLNLYLHIFYEIFKRELPTLYEHIISQQMPDQLWITKWLLTLFLYSLPPAVVIRIWDYIFTENMFSIIKISIGIIKLIEKDLLNLDVMGFDILLRHLKGDDDTNKLNENNEYIFNVQSIDIESLINISKDIVLTREQISQYTLDYIKKINTNPDSTLYYEFYSDYHNNMNSPTYLENFQKKIDQFLIKYELIGNDSNNNGDYSLLI